MLQIQAKFEDALHGRAPEYAEWLDLVDNRVRSPADDAADRDHRANSAATA